MQPVKYVKDVERVIVANVNVTTFQTRKISSTVASSVNAMILLVVILVENSVVVCNFKANLNSVIYYQFIST